MKKWWMEREKIYAVHDNDIENYLNELGLLEKVVNNECYCAFCGCSIDLENLGAIVPYEGKIIIICEKSECKLSINQKEN